MNLDEGEQVALLDQLQHDEVDLDGLLGFLDHDLTVHIVLHQADDVWVIHLLQQRHLVEEDLLEHLQTDLLHVVPLDDLDGIKLVAVELGGCQLDLGVQSLADGLEQLVVLDGGLVDVVVGQLAGVCVLHSQVLLRHFVV